MTGTQVVALVSGEITLGWPERVAIVAVFFVVFGIAFTVFCRYWASQEQQRMASRPQAPGLKHRRIS